MHATRFFILSFIISFLFFSNSYGQIKASFNPPIFQGYVGTINYGSVTAGKTSDKMIIIRRTDTSAGTMTCTITPPATSNYSIINHALSFTVADTSRDTIIIRFSPPPLIAGTNNDTIRITHNADTTGAFFHLHNPMVYALAGVGVKSDTFPKISVTPTTFNFGSVVVGKTSYNPQSFTIANVSDTQRTLTGSVSSLPQPPHSFIILSGDGPFSLDSGMSVQVAPQFKPLVADTLRDTIWVTSNANSQNNKIPVILRGVGVAPSPYPKLSISIPGGFGGNVNFQRDTIGLTPKIARVQISNMPDSGKKLMATITPPKAPFSIDSGSLSVSLDSGKSTLIRVSFSADSAGTYRDSIIVTGSNTDPTVPPTKIYLTGTAVNLAGAHITVIPTTINFGTKTTIGSPPVQMRFVIKNGGLTSSDILTGQIIPSHHPFNTTNGSFNINQNDSLPVIVSLVTDTAGSFTDSVVITSNSNDNSKTVKVRLFATITQTGAVKDGKQTSDLIVAMPNPFTGETTISFSLQEASSVSLRVFDMLGKEVYSSPENILPAGTQQILLEAGNLTNGSYICMLKIGNEIRSIRIILDR